MKQLSHAWEIRDYYTLLLLQKQIDANSGNSIDITANMLKPLIKRLDQEIRDLDVKKYILQSQDLDTSFYDQHFKGTSEKVILRKIKEYQKEIVFQNLQIQEEHKRLRTQKSTKDMLREIEDRKDSLEFYFE